jgi:2-oxoglutarate ferredoxin oxidoreductase subunit gamma
MLTSLLVAGFGGQGVMMIGKLVGECAFEQGVNVTFLPSYGPEQRGGTANCTVVLSDEAIGSPVSDELDVLCAMNQPSLLKFMGNVKTGGVIIANSSLVDVSTIERTDVKVIDIDADTIAYEIGSKKIANIIMFATYMKVSNTMPMDKVRELVLKKLGRKPEFAKMNALAFDEGVEIAKRSLG